MRGHVKWFDTVRGYGFLVVDDSDGDVLLHGNVLKKFGRSSIVENSVIEFELQETEKGRQVTTIHEIHHPEREESDRAQKNQKSKELSGKEIEPARVKWFNKSKGFGFANVFKSNEDVFLHMEVLKNYGLSDLQVGEAIAIRIIDGPRGKMAEAIFSWDDQITNGET